MAASCRWRYNGVVRDSEFVVRDMAPSARLTVLSPGLCTLVSDAGRLRTRSLGVPVGGAADRVCWSVANALLDNPPDAAALEVRLAGPTVLADADLACVVFGAPFDVDLAGRRVPPGRTFTLPAGVRLHVGGAPTGCCGYLCLAGGILTPAVLDSRSSLQPLRSGDVLPCQAGRVAGRSLSAELLAEEFDLLDTGPEPIALRVLPGAQADLFPPQEPTETFRVTPQSNRMGLRLQGRPLPVPPGELLSEPVCPGTVQVTRDGQRIILGVDGQTIGGYPKVAQAIAADLDRLGRLRPGQEVRFEPVTLTEAERLYRQRQERLARLLQRIRAAAGFGQPPL
jgi:antagonist of KipI